VLEPQALPQAIHLMFRVSNSTVVDYPNSAAIGIRAMGGDFTIDSAGALHMNYNNISTTGSLIVSGWVM